MDEEDWGHISNDDDEEGNDVAGNAEGGRGGLFLYLIEA